MEKTNQDIKLLASLSVFRELFVQEKDIYSVLAKFIESCILSSKKYFFTLPEVRTLLKTEFSFEIPDAVIKTGLKRFDFLVDHGTYSVNDGFHNTQEKLNQQNTDILNQHTQIIDKLFTYIESEHKKNLSEKEKENVIQSLIDFLLDEKVKNGFTDYISAFIIKNQGDYNFLNLLNNAKEGVVLYTGIQYPVSFNTAWKSNLTIYLNMEELFHCAGYNGELFKKLFDDFFSLVQELNRNKRMITLKYFTITKDEIEKFFNVSKHIVEGKAQLKDSMTAMKSIVDGCKDSADIVEKKVKFYDLLKKYYLEEENFIPDYSEEKHQFNIYSSEIVEYFIKSMNLTTIDDIEGELKLLNLISYKRGKNANNNFENIGYILLSDSAKLLNIAFNEKIKPVGNIPLATNLHFLTNRFWLKLNKGFGNADTPKSFSVITKAQIALSSHVNAKMSDRYTETQLKFKNGELNEEQAKILLADFRYGVKLPEEIDSKNVEETLLEIISENSIEEQLYKHEYLKNSLQEKTQESGSLKASLENMEQEKNIVSQENIELKKELLKVKKSEKDKLVQENKRIISNADKKYKQYKTVIVSIYIIPWVVMFFCVYKLGWDTMEQWTWVVSIVLLIVPFLYSIIMEESFNLFLHFRNKKQEILEQEYIASNFNVICISTIESEINKLSQETIKNDF
jgi:hypothetical protein